MDPIKGWMLVYVIGSVPVLAFYAAGLSGWFFDYPMGLFVAIFAVLAVPVGLLLFKHPSAPAWNIAGLWVGAGLITVRVLHGALLADETALTRPAVTTLVAVVTGAFVWAAVWTAYFLLSERVARSFG